MELGIAGKVAVVTAASKGLGRATAVALAREGADVVIAARGEAALEEARGEIEATGGRVASVVADMSDPEAPARVVEEAEAAFGRVDIAVANSGGPKPAPAFALDDESIRSAVENNLLSAVRLARAVLPGMRSRGWGRILCITSHTIVQAAPQLSLSNTARTGLWAWAKTGAYDLHREGVDITLNLICPGLHATDRMVELGVPEGERLGDPADFGRVAAFLCSEPARFVNGARVVVDGGATLAL